MRLMLGTALCLALAGCNQQQGQPQVAVEAAWVQLPAVAGRPGSAYFTLQSSGGPQRLAGLSSPRIERIELHDSRMEGGVMRMGPLSGTSFPPGGTLEFAPGGKHAMLFGIDPAVKAGSRVPITFRFDTAPEVTVQAEVRAFGTGHAGH